MNSAKMEAIMTFTHDRLADGKEFQTRNVNVYRFNNQMLECKNDVGEWEQSYHLFGSDDELILARQWDFTEEERIILKNLSSKWQYLARDKDYCLYAYERPPRKPRPDSPYYEWWSPTSEFVRLEGFEHLFESIKWENDEVCYFRGSL